LHLRCPQQSGIAFVLSLTQDLVFNAIDENHDAMADTLDRLGAEVVRQQNALKRLEAKGEATR